MSNDYVAIRPVHLGDLLDGRLKKFGIDVAPFKRTEDEPWRGYITDGKSCLQCAEGENCGIIFERHGFNPPEYILSAIEKTFGVRIVSEYEPEFWGFKTKEAWDFWQNKSARDFAEDSYDEIVKFVRGEKNDLKPGYLVTAFAEVVKEVVDRSPELLAEDKRTELLNVAEIIFEEGGPTTKEWTEHELVVANTLAMKRWRDRDRRQPPEP